MSDLTRLIEAVELAFAWSKGDPLYRRYLTSEEKSLLHIAKELKSTYGHENPIDKSTVYI